MTDPFQSLVRAIVPLDPDPGFTARLRKRLARALDLPQGVTVSSITMPQPQPAPSPVASPAPPARNGISPYIAVSGARAALAFYVEALGARVVGEPIVMPDGSIGHAELEVAGGRLMLSEEHPEIGVVAPVPGEGNSITLHLGTTEVDATIERCLSQGSLLLRPAADYPYGRNGVVRDPFGHRWMIASPEPEAAQGAGFGEGALRHGDIGYVSLWVPDVARAATFFGAVLGWRYRSASGPEGRRVEGLRLHHGLWGGEPRSSLFCCYAVDDVAAAIERVRAAGGTAGEPEQQPYGIVADCVDDAGTRFALFTPPGGTAAPNAAALEPDGHGGLAYVTMEVEDSGRARAFYRAVLGWRIEPGRVADGWQVDGVAPMTGISGGHDVATTVPMYRVDDIASALQAVLDAGGRATEPEAQPYGITASCTDDQGTRFFLGQL